MSIYYLSTYKSNHLGIKKAVEMGLMLINTNFSWMNIYST